MSSKLNVFIVVVLLVVISCKKEEIEFTNSPEIEFVGISPSNAKEFEDEVKITILYRDGNGDIGENEADVKNLFVFDSRNNVEYSYRIQQLAPTGSDIAIEGELEINLKTLSVIGDDDQESASFSVHLVDRAGNKSNTIKTSSITVYREE